MKNALAFGAVAFVLFACSGRDEACEPGCGSYHNSRFDEQGSERASGSVEVTHPAARRIDTSAGLTVVIRGNGTLEMVDKRVVDVPPLAFCVVDASTFEAGTRDAAADGARAPDVPALPDRRCTPQREERTRIHAHLELDLPDDDGDYDLEDVGAELWHCGSPEAELLPVAASDGSIVPGCFEDRRDFVPALREPLRGTLTVYEPPVSLDDLRKEESGFSFHYRIATDEGVATRVWMEVNAWHKRKLVSCGQRY